MSDNYRFYDSELLENLIESFERSHTDFNGVTYLRNERNYKLKASVKLKERLDQTQLETLIAARNFEEAKTRIKQAMGGNNLLNKYDTAPIRGTAAEPLVVALYNLLYGTTEFATRFEKWINLLSQVKVTCWPAATYFLMLSDYKRHIFVKPEVYKSLLENLNSPIEWNTDPNADLYATFQALAKRLRERLGSLGARDMLDVQSFMWVVKTK